MVELVSVHIPKCAGQSFAATLRGVYGNGAVAAPWNRRGINPACHNPESAFHTDYPAFKAQWDLALADLPDRIKVLHGHAPVGLFYGLFPSARRIVWLRDPVEWALSAVFFTWQIKPWTRDTALEEMLSNAKGRNVQTLFTGGNLAQFDFVGLVEHFEEDVQELARLLDWPAERVKVHSGNITRYERERRRDYANDAETRAMIERLNAQDVRLYQMVLEMRG
jgi:hypothetical protein